ncbi:hypothetical protein, partial [Helicobacter japonicus]|uniref:hypothetical protein n=1 Tax=Helicobacter japonicus TaxID=425400 RepID=UPI003F65DF43
MKKLIFVLGLGLVFAACGNKDDAAKDEVSAPVEVIEELEVVTPVEEVKDDKAETSYTDDITENFIKALHNDAVTDNRNLRKLLSLPIKKEELRY